MGATAKKDMRDIYPLATGKIAITRASASEIKAALNIRPEDERRAARALAAARSRSTKTASIKK